MQGNITKWAVTDTTNRFLSATSTATPFLRRLAHHLIIVFVEIVRFRFRSIARRIPGMALLLVSASLKKNSVKMARQKVVTRPSTTRAFFPIEVGNRAFVPLSFSFSLFHRLKTAFRAGSYGCAWHLSGCYDIWFRADRSRKSQGQVMLICFECFS